MDKIKFPKINYIGNKEKLTKWICDKIPEDCCSIFDAFSGGVSVSFEAKKRGLKVTSNDIIKINYLLAHSLIENKSSKINKKDIEIIFTGKPTKGYMYKNFSNKFFFPQECMELDLYKENIINNLKGFKKSLAFTLLRRAMIRKMPYSRFNILWSKVKQLRDEEYSYDKYKRKRAYHNYSIKHHFLENIEEYNNAVFDNGQKNKAFNNDIFEVVDKIKSDIIYLDPPYCGTMNDYFGFYNLLDEYYLSKKLKPFKNNFTKRETILNQFKNLFSKLKNYKYWLISYNNKSYPNKDQLYNLLKEFSNRVEVFEKPHLYKITGKVKKNINTEILFLVEI